MRFPKFEKALKHLRKQEEEMMNNEKKENNKAK
jgi:hypothetical protein